MSSPEPNRQPTEAAAASKSKSDDRRAQLEAFRAAQAAKKAASLGHKVDTMPATAPAKSLKSRIPSSLKVAQKDSAAQPPTKKLGSLSPERLPLGLPKSARTHSSTAAVRAKPPISARGPPGSKASAPLPSKEPVVEESTDATGKAGVWMEAQQAFGFETPRPAENRQTSHTGDGHPPVTTATSLGAGFGDDGDPNMGIRWHIQMEMLRLQQWQILNGRLQTAFAEQQMQAEQQIRLAAEAVVAVREDAEKRRIAQAKALHKQQASEALAAQLPRLEQYSIMQASHEASMEKIKAAVLIAMQQMPLLNGAICGPSAEAADAGKMSEALTDIQNALKELEPRIKPFLGNLAGSTSPSRYAQAHKENNGSLHHTAEAAVALSEVDAEMQQYLQNNAKLLEAVEKEVVHSESIAAQLMMLEAKT